jgi:hypothetical protein
MKGQPAVAATQRRSVWETARIPRLPLDKRLFFGYHAAQQ